MLLMQAFDWEVLRALTKLGIAIAARRPMMATTIMISTSVKPALREVLIFICFSNFLRFSCGVNTATGGLFIITVGVHLLPVATARPGLAAEVPTSPKKGAELSTRHAEFMRRPLHDFWASESNSSLPDWFRPSIRFSFIVFVVLPP